MDWRALGPVAVASILLLGGSWRVAEAGGEGWPLLVLGSLVLGVWIARSGKDDDDAG